MKWIVYWHQFYIQLGAVYFFSSTIDLACQSSALFKTILSSPLPLTTNISNKKTKVLMKQK